MRLICRQIQYLEYLDYWPHLKKKIFKILWYELWYKNISDSGDGYIRFISSKNLPWIFRQGHMAQCIFGWKVLLCEIIWRLQVQFQQQVRITSNIHYN